MTAVLRAPRHKEAVLAHGKLGVVAKNLREAALKRQLYTLWDTRRDSILHGGAHAIAARTHPMLKVESEFIARFT